MQTIPNLLRTLALRAGLWFGDRQAVPTKPDSHVYGPAASGRPAKAGQIALVGAGPGAKDLLTQRAVARLQAADVILYDRLVDPDILDLCRPDAARIFVGKVVGASAWPQDRICDLMVAKAREGCNVVRLKSGDPSIFGRATEECRAARDAGIPIEVVPGVTAASAAAAAIGQSLTERGVSDTLVIATGACREGDPAPDWGRHALPGTTLVYYMAVQNADAVGASIMAAGVSRSTPVRVAFDVSKPSERHLSTDLGHLGARIAACEVRGCAIIMITIPKADPAELRSDLVVPFVARMPARPGVLAPA